MPAQQQKRLTKRQKRTLRQEGILESTGTSLSAKFAIKTTVSPMTENQSIAFDSWDSGYNLMLHGMAGTGKTFLGLYFALSETLNKKKSYEKVYVVRSTVPTRDQGFLPGSQKQKEAVYEAAYVDIAQELFGRNDAYNILKQKDLIRFTSTSFLRGTTFKDCIVVVDEVQNMSDQELHTVMTRIGENSRIIFCGDVKQDDLTSERKKEMSGLRNFMRVINNMDQFDFVEFHADDIVRSALVKSYIIERDKLGL
jgi:phosphate starvation-inducible protein PhoH